MTDRRAGVGGAGGGPEPAAGGPEPLAHLEWPFLEPRHRRLGRDLHEWARAEIPRTAPPAEPGAEDAICRAHLARLAAAGWLGLAAPAAAEPGARFDVRALCLAREVLAARDGLADFVFAMQGLGSAPIAIAGSEDLRRRWLPAVAEGRAIAAFALSEPGAGSDVAALATSARHDGPGYVIDGTKTWISNGGLADFYVVFARTGEGPGTRGISAFCVPADTPGLAVAERIEVLAPHPLARLVLDGCRVPETARLGAPGEGFRLAMATLDVFRPTVGAAALGFARHALEVATAHALARPILGGRLADLAVTRAALAEMATDLDAAALLVYRAAWARDTRAGRVGREASMAKLAATEAAQRIVDRAVQILGAAGLVAGSPTERLYREVRALRIYEGASEVQREIIARRVLGAAAGPGAGEGG